MPVSPTQKQDLMLIKEAFEKKALEQDSNGAVLLPMVSTVQQSRRVDEIIVDETKRYPSVTYQNKKAKDDPGFLKQAQIECIPCLGRIKALGDLDMVDDLFATLMAYNGRSLKNMINLFKTISTPNRIQQSLCESYVALRAQCIPDIARLLSQLTLLMNNLRSFNLKSLKDQLIGLVGSMIVRSLVFGSINYDMYVNLITDVTRCVANDINSQLVKLEPILSREGLEDIAKLTPLDTEGGTLTIQEAAKKKAGNWFPEAGDFNHSQDISKKIGKVGKAFEKKINTFTDLSAATDVANLLRDMIENSISVVDNKLQNATSEMLKFLKLTDGNMSAQIQIIDQIQLIRSVLEVLKTIKNTEGSFDPCGKEAGNRFFSKLAQPGQEIIIDNSDPDNPELVIVPPTIRIDNPVVEDILNRSGVQTGVIGAADTDGTSKRPVQSGRIVKSLPITINISQCIDGKQ